MPSRLSLRQKNSGVLPSAASSPALASSDAGDIDALLHGLETAAERLRAVYLGAHAASRQSREAVYCSGFYTAALRAAEYGLRERVLAAALKGRSKAQEFFLLTPSAGITSVIPVFRR